MNEEFFFMWLFFLPWREIFFQRETIDFPTTWLMSLACDRRNVVRVSAPFWSKLSPELHLRVYYAGVCEFACLFFHRRRTLHVRYSYRAIKFSQTPEIETEDLSQSQFVWILDWLFIKHKVKHRYFRLFKSIIGIVKTLTKKCFTIFVN